MRSEARSEASCEHRQLLLSTSALPARRAPPCSSQPMAPRQLLGVTRQLIGEAVARCAWLSVCGVDRSAGRSPRHARDDRADRQCAGRAIRTGWLVRRRFHSGWRRGLDGRSQSAVHRVGGDLSSGARASSAIAAHAAACWRATGDQIDESATRRRPARPTLLHGKATLFAKRDIVISNEFAEWSLAEVAATRPGRRWPTCRRPAR